MLNFLVPFGEVSSAFFMVNSTAAPQHADPEIGICRARATICMLHTAIMKANGFLGADLIIFAATA
jgi:hypothetical protein